MCVWCVVCVGVCVWVWYLETSTMKQPKQELGSWAIENKNKIEIYTVFRIFGKRCVRRKEKESTQPENLHVIYYRNPPWELTSIFFFLNLNICLLLWEQQNLNCRSTDARTSDCCVSHYKALDELKLDHNFRKFKGHVTCRRYWQVYKTCCRQAVGTPADAVRSGSCCKWRVSPRSTEKMENKSLQYKLKLQKKKKSVTNFI